MHHKDSNNTVSLFDGAELKYAVLQTKDGVPKKIVVTYEIKNGEVLDLDSNELVLHTTNGVNHNRHVVNAVHEMTAADENPAVTDELPAIRKRKAR